MKTIDKANLSAVEWRIHRRYKKEFYPLYEGPLTVAAVNQELVHYQWTYNHYRPRDSLDLMTPMAYYQQLTLAA